MSRTVLVVMSLMLIASCLQAHDGAVTEVGQESCYACHKREYASTLAPQARGHETAGFPTTCADCHRNTSWQPALGGLHPDVVDPKQDFSIQDGPHLGIKCLACHNIDSPAPAANGANTDCVQCHPNNARQQEGHVGAKGPNGEVYAYTAGVPNFCLTCHPNGRAKKHPDDRFPRTDHHSTPCLKCHDESTPPPFNDYAQGKNTNCFASGCHTLSLSDGQHRDVGNYTQTKTNPAINPKNFCLACHPTGRR